MKIKKRCRAASQFDFAPYPVPTPKWIQRKMLQNLHKASVTTITPTRAARVHEILAELRAKPDTTSSSDEHVPVMDKESTHHEPDRQQPKHCKHNLLQRIGMLFRKLLQRIAGFFQGNMPVSRVHSQ